MNIKNRKTKITNKHRHRKKGGKESMRQTMNESGKGEHNMRKKIKVNYEEQKKKKTNGGKESRTRNKT